MPFERTSVEQRLKHRVERELDGWCVKLIPWFSVGLPDRLVLLPGARIYFVETKRPDGRLEEKQRRTRDRLRRFGFECFVLSSRQQVDEWIDSVCNSP